MHLGRLWRTMRWLKAGQVVGRVGFRLQRPHPDLREPPPLRHVVHADDAGPARWVVPPEREASLLSPTRFRLLGVEHDLDTIGWDDSKVPLLWRYNQHYFDDLNASGAETRRDWQ